MLKKIGFIGTGTMAKAILKSLKNSNLDAKFYGYDLNKNNYDFFKENGVKLLENSCQIVSISDFIILAIKPQNMLEVLNEIKFVFKVNSVLISIAAGINEAFVSNILGNEIKFVQVMPNTPLLIQKGAVAMCRGKNVDLNSFNFVKKIFNSGAVVCEVDSNQMNDVVALNGSSPAFIYLFTKGFLQFAKNKQIDSNVAIRLFCASLIGSAHMIMDLKKSVDELIKDVSSPGGTTLAGLSVLMDYDLVKIVNETCEMTAKRAKDLSK